MIVMGGHFGRFVGLAFLVAAALAIVAVIPSEIHGADPSQTTLTKLHRIPTRDGRLLRLVAPLGGEGGRDVEKRLRIRPPRLPANPDCRGFVPGAAKRIPIPTRFGNGEHRIRLARDPRRADRPDLPRSRCVAFRAR